MGYQRTDPAGTGSTPVNERPYRSRKLGAASAPPSRTAQPATCPSPRQALAPRPAEPTDAAVSLAAASRRQLERMTAIGSLAMSRYLYERHPLPPLGTKAKAPDPGVADGSSQSGGLGRSRSA